MRKTEKERQTNKTTCTRVWRRKNQRDALDGVGMVVIRSKNIVLKTEQGKEQGATEAR
jgi:hypothetical protein